MHCRDSSITRIHTTGVYVNIDGQDCGGVALHSTNHALPNTRDTGTVRKSDVHVSDVTVRPFVFSAVRLTGISTRYGYEYWFFTFTQMKTTSRIRLQRPWDKSKSKYGE